MLIESRQNINLASCSYSVTPPRSQIAIFEHLIFPWNENMLQSLLVNRRHANAAFCVPPRGLSLFLMGYMGAIGFLKMKLPSYLS